MSVVIPRAGSARYRFGPFEADARSGELRKHGVRIRLRAQPFQILVMLLEHAGDVVLRDEIRLQLWPNDTVVEFDHGINSSIKRVRDALGETADQPRYVETVGRRGYRFLGEVERLGEPAPLDTTDLVGSGVLHYRIIEKLGAGGMGIVYRAEDLTLGRQLALKFLPCAASEAPRSIRARFEHEARAASLLSHPNICTIYAIEEYCGQPLIAMELVEGDTLASRLNRGPMPLEEALRCGVEIAGAVAAAHGRGIIHRDLKPANVMLGSTGIKVLDFGLARQEGAAITHTGGMIVGTPAYLAPEQLVGSPGDARSDIFSFGCVLFEMATGRRPSEGTREPGVPGEFGELIRRCLAQDPEQRFQTMAEVRAALEEQKRRLESATFAPAVVRWAKWASAISLVAALGLGAWFGLIRRKQAADATVTLLAASPGMHTHAALSPDGKQVAFTWNGETQDNYDIYVQLVGDATPRRLTSTPAFDYSPAWSPDALHIAFLRATPAGTEIMVIPAAGGEEQRLHISKAACEWPMPRTMSKQLCGVGWSPNGKFLSIVDRESPQGPNSIFLLDVESRVVRKLITPPRGSQDGLSVFSPDGRMLAFVRRPASDLFVLPMTEHGEVGGEPYQVTSGSIFLLGFDWSADGRSLVFSSSRGGASALWRVSRSGGAPERVPVGSSDAYWPSLARTGDRLAYSYGTIDENVWKIAVPGMSHTNDPAGAPIRITNSPVIDENAVFSPDGRRIAWVSMHTGTHQLWVADSDGGHPIALTRLDPLGANLPQWSPDGRRIAFVYFRKNGGTQVFIVSADGGTPRRLTMDEFNETLPSWSRDGKWVYYRSNRGEGEAIWKAPSEGGSPVLVARPGMRAVESLDSQFVYYVAAGPSIWRVPAAGGASVLIARKATWPFSESSDGRTLYYAGIDHCIWKMAPGGGEPDPVIKPGKRARWTMSANGIYVLDPDAAGGSEIAAFDLAGKRISAVKLPGPPDTYSEVTEVSSPLAMSSDGRWILYPRIDRNDASIMLVDHFR